MFASLLSERSPAPQMRAVTDSAARPLAVVCSNVVKTYGSGDGAVRALDGVNLEIPCGELVLLVGPSGCGKTTLISIVAGLLDPTSGDVEIFGENRRTLRGSRLVNFRAKNVGFVFQQYNLLPALTAQENVAVPLLIQRQPHQLALDRARLALERVGLGSRLSNKPAALSGGQQQRVAIARALVHEPRLLVCDEPTAALDAHAGRTVMQMLREVAVKPDRAVIVVTHDSRIYDLGDRIISMADGRITETKRVLKADASSSVEAAPPPATRE